MGSYLILIIYIYIYIIYFIYVYKKRIVSFKKILKNTVVEYLEKLLSNTENSLKTHYRKDAIKFFYHNKILSLVLLFHRL